MNQPDPVVGEARPHRLGSGRRIIDWCISTESVWGAASLGGSLALNVIVWRTSTFCGNDRA